MREKLEAKKKVMESVSMCSKLAKEDAKKQEEQLSVEIRSLLLAGTTLSVARKRLQVILFVLVKIQNINWIFIKIRRKAGHFVVF